MSSPGRRRFAVVAIFAAVVAFSVGALAARHRKRHHTHARRAATASTSKSDAASASAPATSDPKDLARDHFERGLKLAQEGALDAALAEFLASRKLFPTRGNTKDAALLLVRLRRFGEALDMFNALLHDFPNLSDADRREAGRQIAELDKRVGTVSLEVSIGGAAVSIDGQNVGSSPLGPVHLSEGSHVVRAYHEGFAPFEERIEVVGGAHLRVPMRLVALTLAGRLHVGEASGRPAHVVIDGVTVGTAPWESSVSPGRHVVLLKGKGDLGTQPASVDVKANGLATITLALEPLDCRLRAEPTPPGALVALDGVQVGHGVWKGRLRCGHHRIEVAEDGFLAARRNVNLRKSRPATVSISLERDPNSPLWHSRRPAHVVADLFVGGAWSPSTAGDAAHNCSGSCSSSLALGGVAVVHVGYELSSGFEIGGEIGVLDLQQKLTGRVTSLQPFNEPPDPGLANDAVALRGLTAGIAAGLHGGDRWTYLARLTGGLVLATASDKRTGTFQTVTNCAPPAGSGASVAVPCSTTGATPLTYDASARTESPTALFVYAGPELRVARRFGRHFEIGVGARVLVLVAAQVPTWKDVSSLDAGNCSTNPSANCVSDGRATYGASNIAGRVLLFVAPGIGLRWDF